MNARMTPDLRQTIVRLLSNMASAKEIQQYLKRFSQLDAARFAVVKVGGAVLRDDLDALVSSLAFLQQVGLTPIVVHGAGPQLDEELAAAGIEKQHRRWPARHLAGSAGRSCAACSRRRTCKLVEALQASDARATSIVVGRVRSRVPRPRHATAWSARSTRSTSRRSRRACKAGSIPVIACLGETAGGQILNVNADFAANELVQVLQPYKIIFLTGTGGLLDGDGERDRFDQPVDRVRAPDGAAVDAIGGMRVKIEQIKDLLDAAAAVVVGVDHAPAELAKELFTHRARARWCGAASACCSVDVVGRARPRRGCAS